MSQTFKLSLQTVWNRNNNILNDIIKVNINTKMNQNFLLYYKHINKILQIYDINSLDFLASIQLKECNFFNFHQHYETVFFVCGQNNIIIYLFDETKKKIEILSKVNGHFNEVIFADFSPFDPNILVSISNNYDIKVYNITKSFPISNIFLDEQLSDIIKLQWYEDEMGIISKNKIIFFNYLLFDKDEIEEISLKENINNFFYFDCLYKIALTRNEIILVQGGKQFLSIGKIKRKLLNNFFSSKDKILFLFFQTEIIGFYISYSFKLNQIFEFKLEPSDITYPCFLLNEKSLKKNEVCKFYSVNDSISFHSIINNNYSDSNINDNNTNINSNNINKEEFKKFIY